MLREFENEIKKQNKKNLRLKIYGKIRNGRLKLKPSVLIKKTWILGGTLKKRNSCVRKDRVLIFSLSVTKANVKAPIDQGIC